MDKLSLYDVMSFFLPGFVFFILLRFSLHFFPGLTTPDGLLHSDFEKGLTASAISLCLGISIHRVTSFLLKHAGWYRWAIEPSIGKICSNSAYIKIIESHLNELSMMAMNKPFYITPLQTAPYFFDHAYYFLEANDKISAAKGYQSLYFFIRNLLTISLLNIPLFLLLQLFFYISHHAANPFYFIVILFSICLAPFFMWIGRFCRAKMVDRVFWSYYILKKEPLKS